MSLVPFPGDLGRYAIGRYLGGNQRRPAQNRRQRRRRRGGLKRSHANVSSRVPTRSIMQGSFSGSIRNYFTVNAAKFFYKSITISDILGDEYASLKSQFGEGRINAMRCYYQPEYGTDKVGQYAACLIDTTSKKAVSSLSYGAVLALPGSTTRKSYQPCGLHWKWTEPTDAEFINTTSTSPICVVYLAPNAIASEVSGELIIDCSVILRTNANALGERCHLHRLLKVHQFSTSNLIQAQSIIEDQLSGMHVQTPSDAGSQDLE